MRITQVEIKNGFKRFHYLKVGPIPETARLVVLLGANGSGKSSFMEALLWWHRNRWSRHVRSNPDRYYYERPNQTESPDVQIGFADGAEDTNVRARAMHFRSAYRYTSDIKASGIKRLEPIEHSNPVEWLAQEDRSVEGHYNRLVGKSVAAFANLSDEITNTAVYAKDVTPLRDSFNRLYPDLHLVGLGDPTQDGTFLFTKGVVENFRYVNLSSGEKAAFDLLLDLHVRKLDYPRSVICLDEPEAHIGLRVQAQLLDELLAIIPDAQLWVATHSPGFMRRAFERAFAKPGEVVFINFDGQNFDERVELKPAHPDRRLWQQVHQIALEDLAALVAPSRVYVCEGDPHANGAAKSFDSEVLRRIFGDAFPDVDFVSGGGSGALDVSSTAVTTLLPSVEVLTLFDRDNRTPEGVAAALADQPGLCILDERDLENYLLSDEVLELGCAAYTDNPSAVAASLIARKTELLRTAPHADDVKAIAGTLFDEVKARWRIARPGMNRHEFMRDVCAPLIASHTDTFRRLAKDLRLDLSKIAVVDPLPTLSTDIEGSEPASSPEVPTDAHRR